MSQRSAPAPGSGAGSRDGAAPHSHRTQRMLSQSGSPLASSRSPPLLESHTRVEDVLTVRNISPRDGASVGSDHPREAEPAFPAEVEQPTPAPPRPVQGNALQFAVSTQTSRAVPPLRSLVADADADPRPREGGAATVPAPRSTQRRGSTTVFTKRQFINNVVDAIVANNPTRVKGLLRKYKSIRGTPRLMEGVMEREPLTEANPLVPGRRESEVLSLVDHVHDYRTGYTIMHLAVLSGNEEIVGHCLESGSATHSIEDLRGDTALSMAMWVHPAVVSALMSRGMGVDVHRVSSRGRNLLHDAVVVAENTPRWPGRLAFIRRLVDTHGVSATLADSFGYTPAAWAREYEMYMGRRECQAVVDFLTRAAATQREGEADDGIEAFAFIDLGSEDLSVSSLKASAEEMQPMNRTKSPTSHRGKTDPGGRGGTAAAKAVNAKAKRKKAVLPQMSREMRTIDRVGLVLRGPYTRLLCIALMILLHNLQYGINTADRGTAGQARLSTFEIGFTIINMVSQGWNGMPFFMALVRVGMLLGGIIGGVVVFVVGLEWLIGQKLLRLQLFGAQHPEERQFYVISFGNFYAKVFDPKWRGSFYMALVGACLGTYATACLYRDVLVPKFWSGQMEWVNVGAELVGVDRVTGLRGFWFATLAIDWLVFVFVVDVMYQQGTLNIYLPHCSYACFARHVRRYVFCAHRGRLWRSDNDVYMTRMVLFYVLLLVGWVPISVSFIAVEFLVGPAREVFAAPLITATFAGAPLLTVSFSLLLLVVVFAQEWTLPSMQEHPFLQVPGFCFPAHTGWLLALLLTVTGAIDTCMLTAEYRMLQETSQGGRHPIAYTIPAIVGAVVLLLLLVRTSLWWEECRCGLASIIGMSAVHLRHAPAPLSNDGKAAAAAAKEQQMKRLRSTLILEASRRPMLDGPDQAAREAAMRLRQGEGGPPAPQPGRLERLRGWVLGNAKSNASPEAYGPTDHIRCDETSPVHSPEQRKR